MKSFVFLVVCCIVFQRANAQDRIITTGVPFLVIPVDARASGMGDVGVATSTDAFSQQYNPAKYAFSSQKQGFSLSYTPYLTSITNDVSLNQLTYYNKINKRSAFATSIRYFGLGMIALKESYDSAENTVYLNELAFDLSYSLKLSPVFSMAVAGRYIRSNLRIPEVNNDASSANGFAVDIAGFYQSEEIAYDRFNGRWRAGFSLQNLGPKIYYDKNVNDLNSNFLPSNLKLGAGFDLILDHNNRLGFSMELNKLLVPTPQNSDLNRDGMVSPEEFSTNEYNYRSIGWVPGIFKSFGDAPGGFKEELKEITYGFGAEYQYQESFAFRTGYFHESQEKGARKFFTMGAGFRYDIIRVDVSYLFSISKIQNPLENTLKFSLTFSFGNKHDE